MLNNVFISFNLNSIKKILKQFILGVFAIILLGIVVGAIFYDDVKKLVISGAQDYLTEMKYGDLQIGDMDISLFQNFPNVAVELNEVCFYEQKNSVRAIGQEPILNAETIYLSFNSWELFRHKNLILTTLIVENGVLDLVTYEDNKTNLERAFTMPLLESVQFKELDSLVSHKNKPKLIESDVKKKDSISEVLLFSIALEKIQIENMTLKYNNPSEQYASQIELTTLEGDVLLHTEGVSCDVETSFEITKSTKFPTIANQGPASLSLKLDFIDISQKIEIHKGALNFKNLEVVITGSYDHKNGKDIDMKFDASSNDLSFLSKLLQEDIMTHNSSLIEKADIILNAHFKGEMEDAIPKTAINFVVKDLNIVIPDGKGKFQNIGFEGELYTGDAPDLSEAKFSIRNLRGKTPGGAISGNVYLNNFKNPYLKSNLNISLVLDGYEDIFNLSNIDSLQGRINFVSEFDGLLYLENKHVKDSIGSWTLEMDEIGFKYLPSNKFISSLKGTISELQNELIIDNLGLNYDNSNLNFNGTIKNLDHFIFNKEQDIIADIELTSNQFYTNHFSTNPIFEPLIKDRISNLLLQAKIIMTDNDIYDSSLPKIAIELEQFSADLDKLPSISNINGQIIIKDSENGFLIDLNEVQGVLPYGEAIVDGTILIPPDFQTLDIKTDLGLTNFPMEYVLELIYEMNDFELIGAKEMKKDEYTFVSTQIELSSIMELFPFAIRESKIENSNISFNRANGSAYAFQNLNINFEELYFLHNQASKEITGIESIGGELHLEAMTTPSFKNLPLDMSFTGANDNFNIVFSTFRDAEVIEKGEIALDLSKDTTDFDILYDIKDFHFNSIEDDTIAQITNGDINASILLSGKGTSIEEIMASINGGVNISGDSIVLSGIDLDDLLKKYQRSQKFNLADISAFMLAGPFGTAITKGIDFTSLISYNLKPEQRTKVSRLIANWTIRNGVIETQDVAFSTNLQRMAFQGSIDFANDSIPSFTAYVIDKKGCSLMKQTISGRFDNLEMGKLKVAKTLLGSVINLVTSVVGANCEIVYTGAIEHPVSSK